MPLEFADLEWSRFALESICRGHSRGSADVEPLIDDQDMDAGDVRFETQGDRLVRVTVELDYVPRTTDTATAETAHAEGTLRRDLEKYRLSPRAGVGRERVRRDADTQRCVACQQGAAACGARPWPWVGSRGGS
ncbi:MAG: hypothetical protein NTX16_06885 [Actinobacteria bacterium]|nr:hypothetical protein [Actinomycetota bacterium]